MPTPAELQLEARTNLNAFTNALISKRANESAQLDWAATFKKYQALILDLFTAYNINLTRLPVFNKFDEFGNLKGTLTKNAVLPQIMQLLKSTVELVKPRFATKEEALEFFSTATNALADQISQHPSVQAKTTSSIATQVKFSLNPPPRTSTPTPQVHVPPVSQQIQVPAPVATMVH